MQLRHMGFDQAKNIREYEFDCAADAKSVANFIVRADLALFVKHHVGLQEGPSLWLKRLSTNLETLQPVPHELTSGDLADHVSAQAAAAERKTSLRKSRSSQNIDTPASE